uniref:ABC transporter ATP-binding protein n=1 Tax=Candidatus Borrarchaeum sp. TaxID=2846742 RepID=UPI00257CE8CF
MSSRRRFIGETEKRSRPIFVLLIRMLEYVGRFKRIIAIGVILALVSTIFQAIDPLVLSWGIDLVLTPGSTIRGILLLGGIYVGLRLSSWLLNSINTWILSGARAGFVQNIQQDLYNHLVRTDLSYLKSEQSGNVTSRVTSDIDDLGIGVQTTIDFSSQILLLVITFVIMWLTNPLIALTALAVTPAVVFVVVLFGTVGQRIMLASQRAYGKVSGQIAEDLSGIHVAKAFNREEETAAKMKQLNQMAYRHGLRFMILMTLMQPLIRAMGIIGIAALLFVGGSLAIGTAPVLTLGEVFLGVILVQRFLWPLLALSWMATQFQASLASMDRILDVLEVQPTIVNSPNAVSLKETSDGITFENLSFAYVEGTKVLKKINFKIAPGETVAMVGHTGAGKTTVAALVNRFYDPQEGRILIGDQDIRDVTLESLHDTIALISQEPY